VDFNIKKS